MFNKYLDLFVFIAIIGEVIEIYLIIKLSNKNNKLEKTNNILAKANNELREKKLNLNKGEGTARSINSQILTVTKLNTGNINNLVKQMGQVHSWLGLLNISNLIPAREGETDNISVLEELQQRVEWIKELEKQQIRQEDYYGGD